MTRTVTLKELRPRLPKVVGDIDSRMERFIITKHGKPVVVMMSVDDYESFLETLSAYSDPKLMKKLKAAEEDLKHGRVKPLDKIEKELGVV